MPQAHTYLTSEHASIDELLAPAPGWLGRPLTPADGLPAEQVDAAVARLAREGFVVPPLLRDLQLRIGNCAPLMRYFQRFEAPEDWALAVADEDEEGEEGEDVPPLKDGTVVGSFRPGNFVVEIQETPDSEWLPTSRFHTKKSAMERAGIMTEMDMVPSRVVYKEFVHEDVIPEWWGE